jgi:mRNA interferase RelE/StbE
MASYEIEWKRSAGRELRNIDPKHIQRILRAVADLADNPLPLGRRKLQGSEQDYRIRVGDYRVIYRMDNRARLVTVYHVRHRGEAYRL